jgi:hypothetical protein
VPREELEAFTAEELGLMLSGEPEIDVADWQAHCFFTPPYTAEHRTIRFLFEVIREWDGEMRAQVLAFITGLRALPVGGFAGVFPVMRIERVDGAPERLPTAHTCMSMISLPEYRSKATLERKLRQAVRESRCFGMS